MTTKPLEDTASSQRSFDNGFRVGNFKIGSTVFRFFRGPIKRCCPSKDLDMNIEILVGFQKILIWILISWS